jgi:hypothetical protein
VSEAWTLQTDLVCHVGVGLLGRWWFVGRLEMGKFEPGTSFG